MEGEESELIIGHQSEPSSPFEGSSDSPDSSGKKSSNSCMVATCLGINLAGPAATLQFSYAHSAQHIRVALGHIYQACRD